jgi:hypothetical protein
MDLTQATVLIAARRTASDWRQRVLLLRAQVLVHGRSDAKGRDTHHD